MFCASALAIALSDLYAAPSFEVSKTGKVHIFTWQGNDGTLGDKREPVFIFDGETFAVEPVVSFKVRAMHLPEGSVVDVVFPEDAKIRDPEFQIPLYGCGLVEEWIKMGVRVNYHHRGNVLTRDELILRFVAGCVSWECVEVTLNGVRKGVGRKAIEKLCTRAWKEDAFLTVRFVHEYTQGPSLPGFTLPAELWEVLGRARTKCRFSSEFQGMKDAWQTASEAR